MSDPGLTDTFTETTHESWLGRIGQSIVGMLIGLVLVIVAIVVLFWNEGRAIQTARSLSEGEHAVVDVEAARVDPANEGKLVHVGGDLATKAPLADPDFAVSTPAARLVRTVETYQWKQESHTETRKNLGGSEDKVTTYTYVRTWSEPHINSSSFREPNGHTNPPLKFNHFETTARDATLGAFRPGAAVLGRLAAAEDFRVDPAVVTPALRTRLGAVTVGDGKILVGVDPANPQIGDMRVSYHIARTGPVSLIGRQSGADLAEYPTKAGDRLLMATAGIVSADAMFKEAESENRIITWLVRAGGSVAIFFGFVLMGRPLAVVGSVVPFIGDVIGAGFGFAAFLMTVIVAPVVIAIAWMWYRPLISIIALVVAAGLVWLLKMGAGRRAAPAVQHA
jgi:Transmembrane protein 43